MSAACAVVTAWYIACAATQPEYSIVRTVDERLGYNMREETIKELGVKWYRNSKGKLVQRFVAVMCWNGTEYLEFMYRDLSVTMSMPQEG